jgi:hypothetical protein
MKEATPEAQEQLYNIDKDIATPIKLGKRTFKVRDLKQWAADKFSLYVVKKNAALAGDDPTKTIQSMERNGKTPSKALAVAILGDRWKILLFHWAFWRYLYWNFTSEQVFYALSGITKKLQLGFFLHNMVLLESMNQLKVKLTQQEAQSLQAELRSESKQTS